MDKNTQAGRAAQFAAEVERVRLELADANERTATIESDLEDAEREISILKAELAPFRQPRIVEWREPLDLADVLNLPDRATATITIEIPPALPPGKAQVLRACEIPGRGPMMA